MPMHVRFWVAILAMALFFPRLQADEMPGVREKWIHLKSPNFELFSSASESDSRNILYQMELLRALVAAEFKLVERERIPVTVFHFGKDRTFETYLGESRKDSNIAGLYSPGPDRARILIQPAVTSDDLREIVFHEYVHHLMHCARFNLPAWLEEGLADIYGAIEVRSKVVEFGRPSEGRIRSLARAEMIPLDLLFAADRRSQLYNHRSHSGTFYAQSWVLVHFWLYGKNKLPKDSGAKFIEWVAENPDVGGEERQAMFEKTFGMTYDAMLKAVETYRRRGSYGWAERPRPDIPLPSTYAKRVVGAEEMNVELAALGTLTARSSFAKYVLTSLGAANLNNPVLYEALGAEAKRENETLACRERWEKALDLGSRNPRIARNLVSIHLESLLLNFSPGNEMAPNLNQQLLQRVRANIAEAPDELWAYESLIWLHAFSRKPDWKELSSVLRTRFKYLERQDEAMLGMAVSAWKLGDNESALALVKRVENYDPSQWAQRGAETLRARIEKRVPDYSHVRPAKRDEVLLPSE